MYITSIEAVASQICVWYAPAVLCYLAWPVLRRRRAYVVAAATLCLTPVFVDYGFLGQWPSYFGLPEWFGPLAPLIVGVPGVVMMLPGGLKAVSMALPFAALVGVIAWLLAKRFLPESRCGTFGASGPEKSGAGRGLAGLRAGVETQTATFPGDKRYGWLWIPLARVQDLLLLLVAVVGYMELCYIPIKFIARLLG